MNRTLLIVSVLVYSCVALSQDTPPISNKPNLNPSTIAVTPKLFSAHPTVLEIAGVLGAAGADGIEPTRIVQELVSGGPSLVPVLADVISTDLLFPSPRPTDSGKVVRPPLSNRVLVIYALDGIGSADAYTALMRIGAKHQNPEIRGASLNALSNAYLDKVKLEILAPDAEVVHILTTLADDSAVVASLGRSVARIAREGVRRWLNVDLGLFLRFKYDLIVNKVPTTMSSPQYWEYWWSQNGNKLIWAQKLGYFQIAH